ACILQCLLVGWVYGARHLREHVNAVSRVQVGRLLDVAIRYLIPGVLAILFVSDFLTDIRQPYGGYPWLAQLLIGRDWLLVTLIVALFVAGRRWRRPLDRSPL
ncbi:MAG: sodium-dependent transporter, partial [Candidatus Omnitrophica bacterium]|nr:sodium-dependent transporter [Candidatus Omnitrophota bacterium]